jgi:hypothetical protein
MINPYDMEESKKTLIQMEATFNTQVDTQVILQIMIDKGICTREEVAEHREKLETYLSIGRLLNTSTR